MKKNFMLSIKAVLFVLVLIGGARGWGQTTIASQGFEPAGDNWTYSSTGGGVSTINTGTPNNQRIRTGTRSYQISNSSGLLTFNDIVTTSYTNVKVIVRISSISGTTGNGADAADYVRIFTKLNTASFLTNNQSNSDIAVNGNSNARWGYNFSGTSTNSGTNAIVTATGGTDAGIIYSTLTINIPDGTSTVGLRINTLNNDPDEIWCIEDVTIIGTAQATSITAGPTTSTTIPTLSCTNGTGAKRAMFIAATSSGSASPINNTTYTANPVFGSGTQIGTTGWYCIFNGTGTPSVTVTGLNGSTTYRVMVCEYDGSAGAEVYNTYASGTGNPANFTTTTGCTAPSQASGLNLTTPGFTTLSASWTSAGGDGTMIVLRPTSQSLVAPTSGTAYIANADYGSAGQINTNNRVVFRAAGTNVSITGLTPETQYTATAYEYNTSGHCYNLTSPPSSTLRTLSLEPAAHAASFTSPSATQTSITLNFSAASTITNADGYIILQKTGASTPTGTPSDATGYSIGNTIGDGTVAAIITSTATASATIGGLVNNTQYSFTLVPYNYDGANSGTYNYYIAATIPSASNTTLALAVPTVTTPTATNIVNTTATLGGNVTSDGSSGITGRGVVWAADATNNNPTIGGIGVTNVTTGGTTGVFTVNATGLPANTLISYRAYATNGVGTTYTTATTFTTLAAADHLFFSTAPPGTNNVGVNLTSFTIQARRPDNSVDVEYTSNIVLTRNVVSGSGNLTGTTTLAASAGVAIFNAVQFDGGGTYTITATSGALTNATSGNIVITLVPVVIAGWDFNSVTSGSPPATFAATTFNANLITASGFSNVTRGPDALGSGANSSFRTTGFRNDGISTGNTDYFQTTLKTAIGYSLNLTNINAIYNGTATYFVSPGVISQYAYSLDGTNFTLIGSPVTSTVTSSVLSVSLSSVSALQNVPSGTTVYIRYYASGQTNSGGWGYFSASSGTNGLEFTGNVLCVQPVVYNVTGGGSYCTGGIGVVVGLSGSQIGVSYQLKLNGVDNGSSVAGTGSAITFGNQTANGTYTVVASNTNGTCNLTALMMGNAIVTISPTSVGGTINGGVAVCSTTNSGTLTLSGYTGSIIKWQYSSFNDFSTDVHDVTNTTASLNYLDLNVTTYFRAVVQSGVCPSTTSSVEGVIINPNTWTGNSNSNWNDASNWTCNSIPSISTNVIIPGGLSTYPVLSTGATGTVRNLTIQTGSLTVSGNTLQIAGNISNSGTLNATAGTIGFNGSTAQSTTGVLSANDLLVSSSTRTVTLGGATSVYGSVDVTNGGVLASGGNLKIKSTLTTTARVLDLTNDGGGSISGNVTVERYMPAKSNRKFSFVSSPVTNLISSNWQQQVYITGPGTGGTTCDGATPKHTNGFDATNSNAPSMYTYVSTNITGLRWTTITNTNATSMLPGQGYRLNVRGDRNSADPAYNCTNQLNNSTPPTPGAVVLSSTGALGQGPITVNLYTVAGQPYTLLGNPYASEISFAAFRSANSLNIEDKFWAYSPMNGDNTSNTYSTYNNGTYLDFPATDGNPGTLNPNPGIFASGTSFFVEAKTGGAGTITFQENQKSTIAQNGNTMLRIINWNDLVRIAFKRADNTHLNEVVLRFANDNDISATAYTEYDSRSFNEGLRITTIKGAERLAIQTRPLPVTADTVTLTMTASSTPASYTLNFSAYQTFNPLYQIFLIDRFTSTTTNIRTNAVYGFAVTTDPASQGDNRFQVVFRTSSTLPVDFITINAETKNSAVTVSWNVSAERNIASYEVERSSDGRQFTSTGTVTATGSSQYSFNDSHPLSGTSYYRIKSVSNAGEIKYSSIAKVKFGKSEPVVSIYPNPVHDQLNISVTNAGAGTCSVRILSIYGTEITRKTGVVFNSTTLSINLASLSQGSYLAEITNNNGEKTTSKFIKN